MKIITSEYNLIKTKTDSNFLKKSNKNFLKTISIYSIYFLLILITIYILLVFFFKRNKNNILNQKNQIYLGAYSQKTNIDLNDEFFQIKSVNEQITKNNISYINTITGGKAKLGNALYILNNLINICEKIRCKNIITPGGLQELIKRPIFYKEYNIIIFPNSYKDMLKVDINLSYNDSFYFHYRKKTHEMRLSILKEEILSNIPKYKTNPNDLFIHIRSGDIFLNNVNPNYSQPPLCFYKKIINEFKFKNIYILSNGNENPVINALITTYPKINYTKDSLINDISKIIYAYNLVMSVSTFIRNLIRFNNNLKKLFIYEFNYSNRKKTKNNKIDNIKIYKMKASSKYIQIMKRKWKKSKEQLDLMLNDNCSNNDNLIIDY